MSGDNVDLSLVTIPACYQQAAERQKIPLRVFLAVLQTEGGTLGQKKRNKNGSYDHGIFQINTVWLEQLAQYGINAEHLTNDRCISAYTAAYIMRYHINQTGDFWEGIGNYHSETAKFKYSYIQRVYKKSLTL